MCGIFAAVGRSLDEPALARVFEVLRHRGPDGKGLFVDRPNQVTLAHTRLAVIDLVTGAQPLESEDQKLVLIANGEIYDFERIRSSLEAKGRRFSTGSDSEVILHLYEEFGLDCFDQLRGEFAFLLYDRSKRLLIAARDRFGIKPLYFSKIDQGFVFGSEMKAIFASGLVLPKLNVEALDPLLNQDPEEVRFPFEQIEHVPPGCYVTVDLDTCQSRVTRYWSPEIPAATAEPVRQPSGEAAADCAATVLEELEEAVRLRLRADVPVGLYLSGGIDSSFVGALMKRNMRTDLHSFSISFVGSERNEQAFTRRAAEFLGTIHHDFAVTKQMLWQNLEDCLWFTELPFVSLAPVGNYLLSAEARKRVTVVLNGQGADEVFLGYRSYYQNAIRETRSAQPVEKGTSARLARLKLTALPPGLVEKLSLLVFNKAHRRRLESARANIAAPASSSKPLINLVQETRIAEMPVDILGFLGDRVEMAHSLEVRVPFLDHELYDAAKSIPVDFKMRNGVEKAVLRDAASGILPEDLRLRRKQGFMLTSEAVDFYGADRTETRKYRKYLSREAFERWGVFSYRAYRLMSLLARVPAPRRLPALRRLRRYSNKLLMYMMQTHMLGEMFVADPRWMGSDEGSGQSGEAAGRAVELAT
jgi:asparagine synthase (glutamine-hydrolysing)